MRQAAEVLKKDKALGGSYPLTVIFFSDGRPSDVGKPGMVRNRILAAVRELCKGYGNRLSFIVLPMVGLTGVQDFSVLKEMKEAAKSAGCEADYIPPEDLRGMFALTSWMTAICAQSVFSRASMVVLGSQLPQDLIKRHVQREREDAERLRGQTHPDEAWQVVGGDKAGPQRRSLTFAQGYSDREWRIPFLPVPFLHEEADGFAVRRAAFGIGRERVVFFFREVKGAASENPTFVGDLMVAKESKCVISDENRKTGFHGIYCKLLTDARRIAKKFNEHIRRINIGTSNVSLRIPTVNFLDASVYTFVDDERGGERRGLLVEPFLSSWDKWNNNDGWVKGVEMGVALRRRMFGPEGREGNEKKAQGRFKPNLPFGCSEKGPGGIVVSSSEMGMQLDPIVEEEEGGGEESEDEQIGDRMQKGPPRSDVFCSSFNSVSSSSSSLSLEGGRKVEHDDVPQALSHFSHFVTANNRTGRKLLIDLQGAPPTVKENEKGGELSFDLTDPAICCADPQQKLGCTNKGQTGIDAFFKTHQRNQVCKLLGLPGK
uniref:Alpha-type protein kinase domain-containing protein n=1 Tax=Chromera velia CCMP2878 TaxID=1169474 RepID=A0A0G4F006_9ALVE|eukprot:Cvel_2542.t1-p1 / transcript=Cvel_2542.t1 / gene=Cvel_2542 / organism=Chromera_velia_CCMP2878 / gene_product=hypothetical protein / transcript_product=hypothetical protein / location=Cvel_scaffold100:80276-81904(-) / protein_length=543 / sequence_SO=supercontig / SO=protein_coding / is_pseudo=false